MSFCFYNYNDEPYQKFMLDIMLSLEYYFEEKETIFQSENNDWLQVIFFTQGKFEIGFSIMQTNHYPYVAISHVRFLELGNYECLFNKQSSFLYKT